MSAQVCVLASSSRGNATAISFDSSGRFILVDAGLTPRGVRTALSQAHAIGSFHTLRAIFLTHLDRDHWSPAWTRQLNRAPVPVVVRAEHAESALQLGVPKQCLRSVRGRFALGETAQALAVEVPHDEVGSTAFRFDCESGSIGHATDLGAVEDQLVDAFGGLDLLSIESNYDLALQQASSRPWFLKRRIMGGRGHLSNDESAAAVARLAAGGTIRQLVLLHLSIECNRPSIAAEAMSAAVPALAATMVVTKPFEPSPVLRVRCMSECVSADADRGAALASAPLR
ncbi:MAG: MBL fold metallo-hydrolase [Planctomycetes bacterium]|nr:MBL fold metallo-hydrolase [Planctomycetota bacterium]